MDARSNGAEVRMAEPKELALSLRRGGHVETKLGEKQSDG
jgi:hypothetical protein